MRFRMVLVIFIALSFFLTGCGPGQLFGPTITPTPTSTNTPTLIPTSTPIPIPIYDSSTDQFSETAISILAECGVDDKGIDLLVSMLKSAKPHNPDLSTTIVLSDFSGNELQSISLEKIETDTYKVSCTPAN